ncbi:hypothetical protein ACOCEA_13960 [Maribacter sp. CXY002]|uniref:tellurite resistance TerB family protein n=1 Tax=Maribacter luteocoastalis TaxID=3407671 RepID=UPI003B676936
MLNSQKVGIELYENIGRLFFAVAMADGKVHPKELKKLRQIVRERWLNVDDIEDMYHADAAYQIETVFEWLMETDNDVDEVFNEFKQFYKEHTALFSHKINGLMVDTANDIANVFSGKNKSELIIIGKLCLLLNK